MPTGKTLDQILAELNQEAEEKTGEDQACQGNGLTECRGTEEGRMP